MNKNDKEIRFLTSFTHLSQEESRNMENKVYVVVETCDSRNGGHNIKVHGCFSYKQHAKMIMRRKAQEEFGRRNPQCWKLDNGDDFSQVRSEETVIVFEVVESNLF